MSLIVPPYPPARYTKDEPEVSAWLRRAPQNGGPPPDYDSFGLVKYHYLADQQATDGEYGLYRVEIAPKGGGPGPHFHRAMSEAFFVLSGTVKLYDGTDWIEDTRTTSSTCRPAASTGSATKPTSLPRS
jgi:mannose-6-phosphate isomerase-like protein (cupin superfamily)